MVDSNSQEFWKEKYYKLVESKKRYELTAQLGQSINIAIDLIIKTEPISKLSREEIIDEAIKFAPYIFKEVDTLKKALILERLATPSKFIPTNDSNVAANPSNQSTPRDNQEIF